MATLKLCLVLLATMVVAGPLAPVSSSNLDTRHVNCRSTDHGCRISCGGFAGLPCPDDMRCVDNPHDNCNPSRGDADCMGVCAPKPLACGGFAGLSCPKGKRCIDDPSDECDPKKGWFDCMGICV